MTEQTQTPTPPVPGSPEYDAAMIAVAEKSGSRIRYGDATRGVSVEISTPEAAPADAQVENPPAPAAKKERPANVPEKFWNAETGEVNTEALLASYAEAERAISKPTEPPKVEPQAAAPSAEAQALDAARVAVKAAQGELAAATTDEAKAAATAKLVAAKAAAFEAAEAAQAKEPKPTEVAPKGDLQSAMNSAAADYAKDGKISDESFKALEAAGITREYATQYAEGLRASAQLVEMQVFQEAGSKDEYVKMSQWAASNMTPEQIAAYDKAVTSGSLDATLGAVKNLKALYKAANGSSPTARIESENGGAPRGDMFRSQQEVTTAMNDPRYLKGDKAFHAEVDRKLEAALRAGINLGF